MVKNKKDISMAARALAMGVVAALVLVGTAGAEVIFQDDFEKDLSQWTKVSGDGGVGDISISANQVHSGKYSLHVSLTSGGGNYVEHSFPVDEQGTLTVWFYDIMDNGLQAIFVSAFDYMNKPEGITTVGAYSGNKYYRLKAGSDDTDRSDSTVLRSKGWHKVEFIVSEKGTKVLIDDIEQPSAFSLFKEVRRIRLGNGWVTKGEVYYDDITFTPLTKSPSLTLTKSLSPSTITEGSSTTITIKVENTGGDAKSVKITDAIPQGFTLVSGSASQEYATLKATESRTFQYTIKATGTGRFVSDLATVTYQDDKGNSYSGASNSATITVQAGQAGQVPQQQAPAAQPKTPGFGAIIAGIGMILALAIRRR